MAHDAILTGRVRRFDDAVGLGELSRDDGGDPVPFHCTQIADGSRTIAEGAVVQFRLRPSPGGRYEGTAIVAAPT